VRLCVSHAFPRRGPSAAGAAGLVSAPRLILAALGPQCPPHSDSIHLFGKPPCAPPPPHTFATHQKCWYHCNTTARLAVLRQPLSCTRMNGFRVHTLRVTPVRETGSNAALTSPRLMGPTHGVVGGESEDEGYGACQCRYQVRSTWRTRIGTFACWTNPCLLLCRSWGSLHWPSAYRPGCMGECLFAVPAHEAPMQARIPGNGTSMSTVGEWPQLLASLTQTTIVRLISFSSITRLTLSRHAEYVQLIATSDFYAQFT
jgi:hypothetical protein